MTDLFDMFAGMGELYSRQREIAAIWMKRPVITGEGKTSRIAPDSTVRIEDKELVDVTPEKPPTHRVILCLGTLVNQFQITVMDLQTHQPDTINL